MGSSAELLKQQWFFVLVVGAIIVIPTGPMHPQSVRAPKIAFGPFEFDPAPGELHKHGHKIRLASQPCQILGALLESPGNPVTREDLRRRLWPGATAGDFEHGLNAAVNKLRQALGDSA